MQRVIKILENVITVFYNSCNVSILVVKNDLCKVKRIYFLFFDIVNYANVDYIFIVAVNIRVLQLKLLCNTITYLSCR